MFNDKSLISTALNDSDAAADDGDDDDEDEDEDGGDSPTEQRLMRQLLRHYERAVRPVRNASDTVMVRMGLTLTQIFNMVSKLIDRLYTSFSFSSFIYGRQIKFVSYCRRSVKLI